MEKGRAVRFVFTNFLLILVLALGWFLGWFSGFRYVPVQEWEMVGLLGLGWIAALLFAYGNHWSKVFHIANSLPMWGLCFLGLGVINSGALLAAAAGQPSPEVALAAVKGIIYSLPANFVGVFGLLWAREVAFWVGRDHI